MTDKTRHKLFCIICIFIITVVICILVLLIKKYKSPEDRFKDELSSYTILIVNGEEVQITDIVDIQYINQSYANRIIITLKDGTKISFSAISYTLKGKK